MSVWAVCLKASNDFPAFHPVHDGIVCRPPMTLRRNEWAGNINDSKREHIVFHFISTDQYFPHVANYDPSLILRLLLLMDWILLLYFCKSCAQFSNWIGLSCHCHNFSLMSSSITSRAFLRCEVMIRIDKDRLCAAEMTALSTALVLHSALIFVSRLARLESIINTATLCNPTAVFSLEK